MLSVWQPLSRLLRRATLKHPAAPPDFRSPRLLPAILEARSALPLLSTAGCCAGLEGIRRITGRIREQLGVRPGPARVDRASYAPDKQAPASADPSLSRRRCQILRLQMDPHRPPSQCVRLGDAARQP